MVETTERIGSSKVVKSTNVAGVIEITDTGATSVFDVGPIPDFLSLELAQARTTQSVALFMLMKKLRMPNHFIEQVNDTTIRVWECAINEQPSLSGETVATHCNLEILFRLRASEKFAARVAGGEVGIHGFEMSPRYKFETPFVESSTKWESIDRYVTEAEAAQIARVSIDQLYMLYNLVTRYATAVDALFSHFGFSIDDGKCEAAFVEYNNQFMIIDVSSLDELGVQKRSVHYGKNLLREYFMYQTPEWYEDLKAAKALYPHDKTKWPAYPALPESLKQQHISNYVEVADLLSQELA